MKESNNWRKQGIIQKYVGLLNREKLGLNIVVYCNVRLKEQSKKVLETFEKHIGKYDEVQKSSVFPESMIIC
jgi:DNA-binding Lrp family transcriptional regulator